MTKRPFTLRLTESAEADLAEIWSCLALEASEAFATRFVRAIERKFMPLKEMPLSGVAREQLAPGLRAIFHGRCAIYYVPRGNEIVIVRVLHGARDVAALAEHGGFEE